MEQSAITKKWQTLSKRVIITGFALAIVVCIIMFVILGVSINNKSKNTINNVGSIFMEGVGVQTTMRYDQVIEQRLTTVDGLRKTWFQGDEIATQGMANEAKTHGFTYLALLDTDGNIEKVYYGQDENSSTSNVRSIKLVDRTAFVNDLIAGNKKVAVATGLDKENPDDPSANTVEDGVILFGVPAEGRSDYAAVIAGIKNTAIVEMLSHKSSDGSSSQRFDSHIIRADGTFVMHAAEDSRIEEGYTYYDVIRKHFNMSNPERLISTLSGAMERMSEESKNPDIAYVKAFSQVLNTKNAHKHIYCEKLDNSDWFFVTVMDYADLDTRVLGLSDTLTVYMIVACVVILVMTSALFIIYFIMNRKNLQQVEEARATAEEANKAKSDFLSNMSHDIRTPMNAVMGMTTVAIANIDNKQQVADCLKKISLSSRHLLGLINDVLDMSKIEGGKMTLNMEQTSLSEVIEGACSIIQPHVKTKKQHFEVYVGNMITENVYSDSVRLNQMLLNLLSNAYKFTPEQGSIEVGVRQEESPRGEDFVRTHIEVQDNGIGMSEEFQKHLFDSFTREDRARVDKTEGTGLGMAITKYIVDSMQGTIEVYSKQGEGTKFHVILDLEKSEIPEEHMVLPEINTLVVGDPKQCDATVALLTSLGVKAESVSDGDAATEKAVQAQADGNGYKIVLLDCKLPDTDGIEIARKLGKKLNKNTPTLLMTAYERSEIEEEAHVAGINGFITKPIFKSTLYYGLLPFAGSAEGDAENEQLARKNVDLKGKRVLVAEDIELNWEIAKLLLTGEGIIVEHAENGQLCVDMLLAHKADYYDAILMDVRMPVMNGIEATTVIRSLKRGYNKVPIIAMTADAFVEDVQKCLACGMNAHIAKPIDIEVVKATLAKHIRR